MTANETLTPAPQPSEVRPPKKSSVCVALAVHNRRELTTQLLSALVRAEEKDPSIALSVVLTDDGSSDGTADAARAVYEEVEILRGDGELYYAAGMALAHSRAQEADPDFILWMNDDVVLDDDVLSLAIDTAADADIVIGAVRSSNGRISYSGMRQTRGLYGRLVGAFEMVEPSGAVDRIDTFQGNFVLLSRRAYQEVGHVDGAFAHGLSDVDYGLRARAKGLRTVLLGHSVGVCENNPVAGTWEDPALSRATRLRLLGIRKSFPVRSQWRFAVRHGRVLAPLWFTSTYASAAKRILRPGD